MVPGGDKFETSYISPSETGLPALRGPVPTRDEKNPEALFDSRLTLTLYGRSTVLYLYRTLVAS